jgi:hypothetical protein
VRRKIKEEMGSPRLQPQGAAVNGEMSDARRAAMRRPVVVAQAVVHDDQESDRDGALVHGVQ